MASTPRDLLQEAWTRLNDEQRAQLESLAMQLWTESLNASKTKREKGMFVCRHCQTENNVVLEVELPDLVTRAKAFEVFANQAYGKPLETKSVEVNVGERTLQAIESMSMQELARIANVEIVDGEVVELVELPELLPPAA